MDYFAQGNSLYEVENYKDALHMYQKSIELNENTLSSMYNSAVCHIKLKEFDSAITILKELLALKQESKYYFNLAYSYAMIGNTQKALYNFNLAWCLDESDIECEKAIELMLKQAQ